MKFANVIMPAAIAAIALSLSACNNANNEADSKKNIDVDMRTYTIDMIVKNTTDSVDADSLRNWHVSGDFVIPERIGDADITQLRDSLIAIGNVNIENGRLLPRKTDGMQITDLNPKKTPAPSTLMNSLSVDLLTSNIIVWENYQYGYEVFMAHGITTTTYLNYSIPDNKILSLSDLMNKGYEKPLLEIIRAEIKEKLGDNLLVPIEEVEIPDNFRIKAAGIEFFYPSTSIAPFSEGEVSVKLTIMDLDGLLTEKAIDLILCTQSE